MHGVPADTDTTPLDTSMLSGDTALPAIEPTKDSSMEDDLSINLQQTLSPEDVNMDTGILNELSEFGNLELDDNLDLPLVGTQDSLDVLEPEVDLEIAMDNVKFLEENPIDCASTVTTKNRHPNKVHRSSTISTPVTSGTPTNVAQKRTISRRGVIKIIPHVLRKPTPEEKQSKKFKCEFNGCLFIGYTRGAVSDHYVNTHPPCYCGTCGKVYTTPTALARHRYVHNEDKPFECVDCHEKFSFQSELTAHRMKHRTINAFRCMFSKCGKEFKRMSELNSHVVIHSGVVHNCTKCDYTTRNPRQLRDHQRSHSDEKRYKCYYCDEYFKYTSGRLRHINNAH